MADTKSESPIHRAKKRMEEAGRQQAEALAKLIPKTDQGRIREEDAKRIAAVPTEIMKQ